MTPMGTSFRLARLEAFVFRAPVAVPVRTAFGVMADRPMVLVRVTDVDGATGWGEAWCNFPSVGAEHRARLLRSVFAELVVGPVWADPAALWTRLSAATRVLAIQSGEAGPLAQCAAAVDQAAWDLVARRARLPLWRMLGGVAPLLGVYASGLGPDDGVAVAGARAAEGYRAFKLKVGFGHDGDLARLRSLRDAVGPDAAVMVDANQGWTVADAVAALPAMGAFGLSWVEEPVAADLAWAEWAAVAAASPAPLAAGENVTGAAGFAAAIGSGVLGVVQPDIAKWGGFSGCLPVARAALAAGLRFCPHHLGGGVGLLASAHLLAAAGGNGWLEVDSNHNPLRTLLMGPLSRVSDGVCMLDDASGLGIEPDLTELAEFAVAI